MAKAGAPKGNKNGARGTAWRDAIHHALAEKGRLIDGDKPAYKKGLRAVAMKFIEAAEAGESWAMRELGDRTDGKPGQAIEISGPDGGAVEMKWSIEVVEKTLDADNTVTE